MALSEADAAREREHELRAEKRVEALLGSAEDRAARVEPGHRSRALADAFEVPGPGASRTLQDVVDEYVAARWQDHLGLTRGFEHVRDVASDGSWGEQVACVRQLYREVDHAIVGDRSFGADVADEVGALCRKAGATEFDMAMVQVKPAATVVDVLHRHADGSPCELPRFPRLPPRRGSFDEAAWDSHLEKSSRAWEERQREAFGLDVAGADRAVRDGFLALRGAAFFSGGSHYSSAADREPDRAAAGGRGDAGGAPSAGAVREPGEELAGAADRARSQPASAAVDAGSSESGRVDDSRPAAGDRSAPGGGAASQPVVESAAAGESDGAGGRRARRGGEDEGLASRLAHAADHPDRVVCEYVVECFDGVVQRAVARFDRGLDKLRGVGDPAAVARGIEEQLATGRAEFRDELEAVREQVVGEVKEALGDGYRLGSASRSVHSGTEGVGAASGAIDVARRQFREEVDSARQESVESLHVALGGRGDFGPPREVVPPVASPGGDAAAREARADFVGTPRALVLGHLTRAAAMVAAARGPESLAKLAESIDSSPLRQGALEAVGCDPVLVGLCADVRDAQCRARGAEPAPSSPLRSLASDLRDRHLARCRDEPAEADRDEVRWAAGRAALRSGACAGWAAALERPYGAACRVEIDARLDRVPSKLPADADLGGLPLSLGGRAWLERMRGHAVVPEAKGPDRAAVEGARRGLVRSLLGRRAQGFDRVLQLAETRRGRAAAAVSSRLLRWGTSAGPGRLRAVGRVLGSSQYLMAGLVRSGADPLAVAAASSPGAARAVATGSAASVADGARASDHRRLVQVAEELDRRQRGAELSSGVSGRERAARLEHWAACRGRRGAVPELLKGLHGDRHQAITRQAAREQDRALEARRSGDRDFDLVRERVRDRGVEVWAQAWRGRGVQAFDGRDWWFDGKRTHPDGVPRPGSVADGVKAMLALSGGQVRHGRDGALRVGKDGVVEVPQGLGDEQRQSALIYGAAKAIVVGRNPSLAPGNRETVALSGMLASAMARELDATYEPPGEARAVDSARVSDGVLRRGNALVQEVGAQVRQRMETMLDRESLERDKEVDHQVDFVAKHSFGEEPRRAAREESRERAGVELPVGARTVDLGRGRG